jgi:hypothetical protein
MKQNLDLRASVVVGACVGLLVIGLTGCDGVPALGTGDSSSKASQAGTGGTDPDQIARFYDEALSHITEACADMDKTCERRVKERVAKSYGISEDEAVAVYLRESVRRMKQGR